MGFFAKLFGRKTSVKKVKQQKTQAQKAKYAEDYFSVDTGASHGVAAHLLPSPIATQAAHHVLQEKMQGIAQLPNVWNELQQAITRGDSSKGIAKIVRHDPGLTAEILKVANSAGFGSQKEISDISQAVVRLGSQAVRAVAIKYCTSDLTKQWRTPFSIQRLWKHAMAVSMLSTITAEYIPGCDRGVATTLGLLHDIGRTGLNSLSTMPFHYKPDVDRGFLNYEYEHFDCTHIEAGVLLAQQWNLPEVLQEGIRFHHHPALGAMDTIPESVCREVLAVYLADYLSIHFDFQGGNPHLVEPHPSFAPLLQHPLNDIAHDSRVSKELWRIQAIDM